MSLDSTPLVQEEPGPAYATWLLSPDENKVELRRQHVSSSRLPLLHVELGLHVVCTPGFGVSNTNSWSCSAARGPACNRLAGSRV